ncbi:MAG: PEP-CTERM sorting domain-containing protein [Planctomycetota bacterium]
MAASKQIIDGDTTITLALTATQRFSNPPLTNDGLGTFFATPGSNFGGNGESGTEGALWNFNFYIEVEGANGTTPALTDYDFTLFYDFDAGFDTGFGDLGTIDLTASLNGATFPNPNPQMVLEGSQNLLFGFLASPIPGVLDPPAGSFDANATGEYTFAIGVTDGFFPLESVAIDVSVVPEPATALLAGLGVLAVRRRR